MTKNQMRVMERLRRGFQWEWFRDPETDDLLRSLMDEGLCTAREDIAPGMLMLTQKGKAALEAGKNNVADNHQKNKHSVKPPNNFIQIVQRFWKLFCGVAVIVGFFTWDKIFQFLSWLLSLLP